MKRFGKKKANWPMTIQEGLPNSIDKELAIVFGEGIVYDDFSNFEKRLDENAKWMYVDPKLPTIYGKSAVIAYWKEWIKRAKNANLEIEFEVKLCVYYASVCLSIQPVGYATTYVLFNVKDSKIILGISASESIFDKSKVEHKILDYFPLSVDFVKQHTISQIAPKADEIPCMHCGKDSEFLQFHHIKFLQGNYEYDGVASICLDCNKVVKFYPNHSSKREIDQAPFDFLRKTDRELQETSSELEKKLYYATPLKESKYIETLDKVQSEETTIATGCMEFTPTGMEEVTKIVRSSLYEIAANFDEHFLTIFYMRDYDKYEQIKNCYVAALEDGIYEAANNLGVLVCYIEKFDQEKGFEYFKLAAEHGSKAAFINVIHPYWNEGNYNYIHNLLSHYNGFNEYATEGIRFQLLFKSGVFNQDNQDYTAALKVFLPKIDIEKGWFISIHVATLAYDNTCFFAAISKDSSRYFDFNEEGIQYKDLMDFDIYEHIYMPKSEGAIWQLFLLEYYSSVLPYFWHGGYSQRIFIWDKADFKKIKVLKDKDLSAITDKSYIQPSVCLEDIDNGFLAHIYCCYWNEWEGGLVREHIAMKVVNNKVVEYKKMDNFIIFPYHCGIWF